MLGVSSYTQDYVDACRARVQSQLAAYDDLVAAAREGLGDRADAAIASLESALFPALVQALDHSFVHRLRGKEGKDGNPLNEVRVLSASLLNGGALVADKTIKLDPAKSLLGYAVGDEIKVGEEGFTRLAEAYFAAVERAYS